MRTEERIESINNTYINLPADLTPAVPREDADRVGADLIFWDGDLAQ